MFEKLGEVSFTLAVKEKMSFARKQMHAEREYRIALLLRDSGVGLCETRKLMRTYRIIYKAWAEAKAEPLRKYALMKKERALARSKAATV